MTGNRLWLCPDQTFDGQSLRRGMAVAVDAGRVVALRPVEAVPADAPRKILRGVLTPGFVDLQVNGAGGVLLNNDPSLTGLMAMAEALRRLGTVAFLPTVITDAPEVLARAADAVIAARQMPQVLGLHIEGPHISQARRGTHTAEHIRPLDAVTIGHVERLMRAGFVVLITLAPEAVVPGQIADLVRMGAIVSIGHSDATSAGVAAALAEGAGCFTHLFNAMSPMLGRAPGVIGAAIASQAYCGFICDGQHVSDAMLGLAIRARPVPERMFVVSDCMATVGGPDRFSLYGREICLRNGRLINAEGALAGAHVTLAESVARLIGAVGIAPEQALRMAISVPARLIRAENRRRIVGQLRQDLLLLGPDWLPLQVGV